MTMDKDRYDELMALAARAWIAAESIDALYGGDRVWRWTHRQCARLEREGRLEDLDAVGELTRVLEDRLAMERERGVGA